MEKSRWIEAGKIINTHGVSGEVKAEVWLDSPQFLKRFKRIFINGTEYPVCSVREQKSFAIIKIAGIDDFNAAAAMKEKVFFIAREDAKLPKGAFFLCDIIGSRVVDENGRMIGILEQIEENPAQMIYVVKGDQEHFIPAVPEFILSTDTDSGIITVHLIEGM